MDMIVYESLQMFSLTIAYILTAVSSKLDHYTLSYSTCVLGLHRSRLFVRKPHAVFRFGTFSDMLNNNVDFHAGAELLAAHILVPLWG